MELHFGILNTAQLMMFTDHFFCEAFTCSFAVWRNSWYQFGCFLICSTTERPSFIRCGLLWIVPIFLVRSSYIFMLSLEKTTWIVLILWIDSWNIWVNYHDRTLFSLTRITVNKGKHPQIHQQFRLVKYGYLPRSMDVPYFLVGLSHDFVWVSTILLVVQDFFHPP